LEPGSVLVIEADPGGRSTHLVGPDGTVGGNGQLGFLSMFSDVQVVFSIEAVAAGGANFVGDLAARS